MDDWKSVLSVTIQLQTTWLCVKMYEALWFFCLALFASLFLSLMFVVGLVALTVGMIVAGDDPNC
jgi:hypothetical protein